MVDQLGQACLRNDTKQSTTPTVLLKGGGWPSTCKFKDDLHLGGNKQALCGNTTKGDLLPCLQSTVAQFVAGLIGNKASLGDCKIWHIQNSSSIGAGIRPIAATFEILE